MSDDSEFRNSPLGQWLTTFVDHPPLWLAILIGAAVGMTTGWGMGQAIGFGWVGGILGVVLGGIVGIDYYLPRPDWAPTSPGESEHRYAGPFRSTVYFLGCTAIAVAGGFYFGQADQRLVLARQKSGEIQGTLTTQFAYGMQRSITTYHDIKKAEEDIHGGLMLRTNDDLPEFVGAISGDKSESINRFIQSQDPNLSLTGQVWLKFVSPGFYAVALLMGWLTIRQFKFARHQLSETIDSRR